MMRLLRNNILIISILLLAAYLRLSKIGEYMTFLGDEGRDAIAIYNITRGIGELFQGNIALAQEHLTLLGPTASVGGFFMGPAYFYLVTPFYVLFNYNPIGPSVFIALLSVATVWLMYVIGSEFFNKKAGLIAALLYALSPLVIIYSRSSWNPNAMPFFTILTLYVLYKAVQKQKLLLFLLSGFLFGIAIQLHYIELAVGLIIILYVIGMAIYDIKRIFSLKLFSRIFIQGIIILAGFLLGFSPFIAFEARHDFLNTQSIINFIFTSGETGASTNYVMTVWDIFIRLFNRLLLFFPLPQDFKFYPTSLLPLWYSAGVFIALSSLGYFVVTWKKAYAQRNTFLQLSLLAFWLGIGVLFFGFYKKAIYDYYFEFMFPLPFLLLGNVLAALYDTTLFGSKNNTIKWVGKGMYTLVMGTIIGIFIYFSPLKPVPNLQLQKTQQIADFVLEKAENKPFNFALITGGNSDHGYRYFFIREGKEPVTIENPMKDPKRETVTDQLLVVCDSLPCSPLGDPLWEIAGFGRAEIVGHWKVSYVEVYKLVPYKGM